MISAFVLNDAGFKLLHQKKIFSLYLTDTNGSKKVGMRALNDKKRASARFLSQLKRVYATSTPNLLV